MLMLKRIKKNYKKILIESTLFLFAFVFIVSATGTEVNQNEAIFDTNTLFLDYGNNRVGIGTTNPANPLNVIGDLNITGISYVNLDQNLINNTHILDGTILGGDLDLTDITLADFTNDAGFVNAVDIINSTSLNASYVLRTDWTTQDNYPTGCSAGSAVTVIGDTLTCVAFSTGMSYTNVVLSNDTSTVASTWDIANYTVSGVEFNLLNHVLSFGNLVTGFVNTTHILDRTITLNDLADSSVNTTHISDATILSGDLDLTDITLADFTNDIGYLNVVDAINSSQLNLSYVLRTDWTTIDDYPTGCSAGSAVTVIGDTLTCVAFSTGMSYTNVVLSNDTSTVASTWDIANYTASTGIQILNHIITNLNPFDTVNIAFTNQTNTFSGNQNITGDIGATGQIAGTFVGNGSGITNVGGAKILGGGILIIENTTTTYNVNETNITIPAGTLDANDILILEWMIRNPKALSFGVQSELHETGGASPVALSLDLGAIDITNSMGSGKVMYSQDDNDFAVIGTHSANVINTADAVETAQTIGNFQQSNIFTRELILQIEGRFASEGTGQNATIKYVAYYLDG